MSIRGQLSTMQAGDVLTWAGNKRLSGVVTFDRKRQTRSIAFDDGNLLWASSSRREEQLGYLASKFAQLSERGLADALSTRAETGVPLGKIILMSGLANESLLVELLTTKIVEAVTDVMSWREGVFELLPKAHLTAGVTIPITVERALELGQQRCDALHLYMQLIGNDDATFFAPPSSTPPRNTGEAVDSYLVWQQAAQKRSVAEITAEFRGARFAVIAALVGLLESNALTLDRRRKTRTNSATELALGALGRLREGDKLGAYQLACQALATDANDQEIRKTHATIERAYLAQLARDALARKRVPKQVGKASNTDLSPLQKQVLDRVDGIWDIMSILRSGPGRESDSLLAFAELMKLGYVE